MQLAVLGRAGSSGGAALSLSEGITMGMWCGLSRHRPEAVQALRMTVSSLAAFGLASAFGLPQGFWAVVSALIVTQGNVGGSLKAAFDRFAGSVCGAVYGGAVAFAIPHGDDLSRAVALVVAVAPLSILAASLAGFRVAPITAIIVLLGTAGATLGPLGFALDRILEVGLGCAVGLLASVLVVPARASRSLLDAAARVARLLADQLEALARPDRQASPDPGALVAGIRKGLNGLETLIGEAARERRSRITRGPDLVPLLRTLLRLRHDIVMLRRAAGGAWDEAVGDHLARPWADVAQAAAARLKDLGDALTERRAPGLPDAVAEAVGAYRAALDRVRRQGLTRSLPVDEVARLFGVGFALDQLRRDLDDLAERAGELAAERGLGAEG
jgi:uncharacterized membrane protein YccC